VEAFKIEQKCVIDEYYETKRREGLCIDRIRKMGRVVSKQENMILELQNFMSDTLSEIFDSVRRHQDSIVKASKNYGINISALKQNDAFAMYNSYVTLARPL